MRITFRLLIPAVLLALPLAAAGPKPTPTPKAGATAKPEATPEAKPATPAAPAPPAPLTPEEKEKTFYALGQAVARNLQQFVLSEAELKSVVEGLTDGVMERPAKTTIEEYMPKIQQIARERGEMARVKMAAASAKAAEPEKKAGAAFADKAAAEPGAVKKPSGLIYQEVKAGTGESPKATDKVKVHYTGKLIDGTVFDSSVERGQPAEFPLNGVIPCWTEGVQLMKVGGKARLICPSTIAYGDNGAGAKIKPGSTLAFDVELLEILPPNPAMPQMPMGHPDIKPEAQPEKK